MHDVWFSSNASAWIVGVVAFVVLAVLYMRARAEYERRTYDPTWAFQFDDRFNSSEMKCLRSKAAATIKERFGRLREENSKLSDIDDVLDFFEDLGFYTEGHQLTPEVVHHTFYYWIERYYLSARDYIEFKQQDRPTVWDHVKYIYEITNEVELERTGKKFLAAVSNEDIQTFLDEEIALSTPCMP